MAEKLDPQELVTPDEIAISNMWEIAAIVDLLERKGLCTKKGGARHSPGAAGHALNAIAP